VQSKNGRGRRNFGRFQRNVGRRPPPFQGKKDMSKIQVFVATSMATVKTNVLKKIIIGRGRATIRLQQQTMMMISIHIRRNPRMMLHKH